MVGGRAGVVPRFVSASNSAGFGGGVRSSEEAGEWIDLTLLEGLVGRVGGSLWRRVGKLCGHAGAGDESGRSCLRDNGGGDNIPGARNGAGGVGGSLSGDGGGDESDGRHFADLERQA